MNGMAFKSVFARSILEMMEYKNALGYNGMDYRQHLLNFDRFCVNDFPNATVLTKEIVEKWGQRRSTEHNGGLGRRLQVIREFGKYLIAVGQNAYVYPSDFMPKQVPYTPHIFTDSELELFFDEADHIQKHGVSPNRELIAPVIFRLILGCGLRPGEALLLKSDRFDFRTNIIYLEETKGHKDRRVAVCDDLALLCRKFDNLMAVPREYFFQRPDGRPYATRWLDFLFNQCLTSAGVQNFAGAKPRAYDFRHTYASRILMQWIDAGIEVESNLPYLSAYLGHSSISGTLYYVHLLPERLKKADFVRNNEIIPGVAL